MSKPQFLDVSKPFSCTPLKNDLTEKQKEEKENLKKVVEEMAENRHSALKSNKKKK